MNSQGSTKVPLRVSDLQADVRRRFVSAVAAQQRAAAHLGELDAPPIDFTPFTDLICGARGKRTGRPCPQKGLFSNGRCRWHGGLSTGPRTPEGKARSMLNHLKAGRAGGEPHEADQGGSELPGNPQPKHQPLRESTAHGPPQGSHDVGTSKTKTNGVLVHICEYMAARPGRWLVASGIATALAVPGDVVEAALKFLVIARRAERHANRSGPALYRWTSPST